MSDNPLDSLADMVTEEATFADLSMDDVVEPTSEPDSSKVEAHEAYSELEDLPEDDDDDGEAEDEGYPDDEEPEDSVETASNESPEFVEKDWYGRKVRIDKDGAEFIDTYFTKKNQEIAEQRRAWEQERESVAKKIEEERLEVERRQRMLQQHLDDNPEFAESWRESEEIRQQEVQMRQELEELKSFRESFERDRAKQALDTEVARLEAKYPLANEALEQEDIRDMAIQKCRDSDFTIELEDAYASVVSRFNKGKKAKSLDKLKRTVNKAKKTQGLTSGKRSSPSKTGKSAKRPSLDSLLATHMKWSEERFK